MSGDTSSTGYRTRPKGGQPSCPAPRTAASPIHRWQPFKEIESGILIAGGVSDAFLPSRCIIETLLDATRQLKSIIPTLETHE